MSLKTMIIAEAGVNHDGCLDKAKRLIDAASNAKADAVKFQTFRAHELATTKAALANYQQAQGEAGNQLEMLKRLELTHSEHHQLVEHATARGIQFLSTPFDLVSLDFLDELGIEVFKIASGEMNNYPLLQAVARKTKPIILSTGMATLAEIRASVDVLKQQSPSIPEITLLHCNTEYPTPFPDVNLLAIHTLRDAFPEYRIGYSDHSLGIEVPIAAVAMGAVVIEKHFTLDKQAGGPDHAASLDGDELKAMVHAIRNIEDAFGSGEKKPSPSEIKNRTAARKSIVAAQQIVAGELFSESNLTTKRPGNGRSPMGWPALIGTTAPRNYEPDEQID